MMTLSLKGIIWETVLYEIKAGGTANILDPYTLAVYERGNEEVRAIIFLYQ
jgi:hypothetical protein